MTATNQEAPENTGSHGPLVKPPRQLSVDALRGLVMFLMIFVNDLAGAPEKIVPDWMVHFSDRHRGGSGMTFVDLVFPAFLFIVGMSIPFALGGRLAKGQPLWKIFFHVLVRTLSLLLLGILMVNESPNSQALGWSAEWWTALMYLSAIVCFCEFTAPAAIRQSADKLRLWRQLNGLLRALGFVALIYLALAFRGNHGRALLTLYPFTIHHSWYGILGLIGWAYLVGSVVFLIFRTNPTAVLGCVALLFCFYPADRKGFFDHFWPARIVDFGSTLGSQAAITVAGILLASVLFNFGPAKHFFRLRFALWFIGGFAFAALLLNGLYGISKNNATPSWCLWSCAITAALWLGFHWVADVRQHQRLVQPFAVAGQNVLLAYLLSEGMESFLQVMHLDDWYGRLAEPNLFCACARSAGIAALILAFVALVNRFGFKLKL